MFVGSVWTVSDDTYLEVMRPPAQPPTHQPLPTHPPPSLNLTPPHSFGRFKSIKITISFHFRLSKKINYIISSSVWWWLRPFLWSDRHRETEIMRMQARIQVKAKPRCNSRTPDTWTRGGGAAAHCWPQPHTTSAGHCHGDTSSGGPSAPVFVSIQIVMNYIINTSMSLKISSKIWLQDKRRRSW